MNSSKAKRMTAEAIRAEACERVRKAGGAPDARAKDVIGHAAAGWRLQWTDGSAAIFEPDPKAATRPQLPERWAELMTAEPPALQWQPYREMARAVHVLQAVARGSKVQHVRIMPEPAGTGDGGRVVLHYADPATRHRARTWADATFYAPGVGQLPHAERAALCDEHAPALALPYLAALLWADESGWIVRRARMGGLPVVVFHAPEVRAMVAEVNTDEDETPATPADEDGAA